MQLEGVKKKNGSSRFQCSIFALWTSVKVLLTFRKQCSVVGVSWIGLTGRPKKTIRNSLIFPYDFPVAFNPKTPCYAVHSAFSGKKINLLKYPPRLSSVSGTLRLISRLLFKTPIHTFSTFVNKFKCQSNSIICTTLTFKPQSKETSKHNTSQLDVANWVSTNFFPVC